MSYCLYVQPLLETKEEKAEGKLLQRELLLAIMFLVSQRKGSPKPRNTVTSGPRLISTLKLLPSNRHPRLALLANLNRHLQF